MTAGIDDAAGVVVAVIRVELASCHFRYWTVQLERRASDLALVRAPVAEWLEPDCRRWLEAYDSSEQALAAAIERQRWGGLNAKGWR